MHIQDFVVQERGEGFLKLEDVGRVAEDSSSI